MKYEAETKSEDELMNNGVPIATLFVSSDEEDSVTCAVLCDSDFSENLVKQKNVPKIAAYLGGTVMATFIFEAKRLDPSLNVEQCFAEMTNNIGNYLDKLEKVHRFDENNDLL